MANQLSKLTAKADAVANSASVLVSRTIREVRGELYALSDDMNLAGSADDRDYAYDIIRRKWARLSRRLDALMTAQNELAARGAAKDASAMTGLTVKYSAARANAIMELVTPAQGENLAAVFTQRMSKRMIDTLRESTVAALREQAVAGGSVKQLSREMATRWAEALKDTNPQFVDAGGHVWDTGAYFQMNARTNTMRVYNDCLIDNVARETGSDLMRISTGGDPDCDCFAWEGCIISVSGKTKGFPTYEDARKGGCFHPNCTHTLEYVDEVADADEIALQKDHPVDADMASDPEAQDERRYEIDQARKMRDEGMTKEQARVAVDRDNLSAAIRNGLVRPDAEDMVRRMTDEQVTRLCPNGNPPTFEPTKGTKKHPEAEKWNHGRAGGVVHVKRDADLAHILSVCKVDKPEPPTASGNKPVRAPKKEKSWTPTTELERETDAFMTANGFEMTRPNTTVEQVLSETNPKYHAVPEYAGQWSHNCQRVCGAAEMVRRGYNVTAKPQLRPNEAWGPNDPMRLGGWKELFKDAEWIPWRSRNDIERKMAEWGNGARAEICIMWSRSRSGHVFLCEQIDGHTVFYDAQSGSSDVKHYFGLCSKRGRRVLMHQFTRIDNLEPSDKMLAAIQKRD